MPATRIHDRRHVAELNRAVDRRFEVGLLIELRRTADVEGPHRQLGTRLADRLGGDNADRLANVDRRTASEVAAVALGADALLGGADQRAADLDTLQANLLDAGNHRLVEQRTFLDDRLTGLRIDDVFGGGAAEHAVGERRYRGPALDDRAHLERPIGPAVFLDDDGILRHVDQTAGQISRVRRLQRRVRQALAGAVGRVEVFEDGQALLEV